MKMCAHFMQPMLTQLATGYMHIRAAAPLTLITALIHTSMKTVSYT